MQMTSFLITFITLHASCVKLNFTIIIITTTATALKIISKKQHDDYAIAKCRTFFFLQYKAKCRMVHRIRNLIIQTIFIVNAGQLILFINQNVYTYFFFCALYGLWPSEIKCSKC